jgi:hypothetical protein
MINLIKTLLPSSLNSKPLKVDFDLISTNICVPEATKRLDSFSFQGKLKLTTMEPIIIKSINIQFSGYINSQATRKTVESLKVIENTMEVLTTELEIFNNSYEINFELLLPRSLSPTINSNKINLSYTLSASVKYNNNFQLSQIPIKVYNNQLASYKDAFSTKFHYIGSINNNVSYTIDFYKRFFTTRDSIDLWVTINPKEGAKVSSVEAILLQNVVNLYNIDPASEVYKYQEIEFDKMTSLILNKSSESLTEFKLGLQWKSIKMNLIPSTMSTKFEVKHSIKILINYQSNEGEKQTRFILIPIFIVEFGSENRRESELPIYKNVEIEAALVLGDEKPPTYIC